jgi:hypothetical protein
MMQFCGDSRPLTAEGLACAAETIGVKVPEIWALLTVETRGAGYLPDRRPLILFERHVFHKLTRGAFAATSVDICNPKPGGYGPGGGAHQYNRLTRAIALDATAAMQSASWGLGQVMGYHAKRVGYADVNAMVAAMARSEDEQLTAVARFIHEDKTCRRALIAHDWPSFARAYNGPAYAINKYDVRLAQQYQRWAAGPLPDLSVRSAQIYLTYRGYTPGPVDGLIGRMTRQAIEDFQECDGLPVSGEPDETTLARLAAVAGSPKAQD